MNGIGMSQKWNQLRGPSICWRGGKSGEIKLDREQPHRPRDLLLCVLVTVVHVNKWVARERRTRRNNIGKSNRSKETRE